ncbi:MAG: flavodoxin, partial [Paludibacteraceae bacterium]|nr:flavodoxin [Paludibacteraceae bacterium]
VFIMSPIYWGTYAPEIETALSGLDFTGKTVRIISTHEGSGLASMVSDVQKMCKGADVDTKGLAIRGSRAKESKQIIADWL